MCEIEMSSLLSAPTLSVKAEFLLITSSADESARFILMVVIFFRGLGEICNENVLFSLN